MKAKDWMIAFILTAMVIVLGKYSILEVENQKRISNLESRDTIVKVEPIKVDSALVDRLEDITRENERLIIENSAMKDEIKNFGGWWEDWASKNVFPKEGSD